MLLEHKYWFLHFNVPLQSIDEIDTFLDARHFTLPQQLPASCFWLHLHRLIQVHKALELTFCPECIACSQRVAQGVLVYHFYVFLAGSHHFEVCVRMFCLVRWLSLAERLHVSHLCLGPSAWQSLAPDSFVVAELGRRERSALLDRLAENAFGPQIFDWPCAYGVL
jgi:hypothetical protein